MTGRDSHHLRSRAVIGPLQATVIHDLPAKKIEGKREKKRREERRKEPQSL